MTVPQCTKWSLWRNGCHNLTWPHRERTLTPSKQTLKHRKQQPSFTCIHWQTKTWHPPVLTQICIYPSYPQLSPCQTLRVSDPYCAGKSIFLIQNDSLIYSILLCSSVSPDPDGEKRGNSSIITFYSFIQLQQWRCHLEMAPMCYLVQVSAYFMSMTEISR